MYTLNILKTHSHKAPTQKLSIFWFHRSQNQLKKNNEKSPSYISILEKVVFKGKFPSFARILEEYVLF
jgi:hypothetical protein